MNITVMGCGYVGLVTGLGLSRMGHQVLCADRSLEKINMLKDGRLPIWETGLDELLAYAQNNYSILFTRDLPYAITHSDILLICVGTPSRWDGEADLSQIWSVVKQVAIYGKKDQLIIIKSTVPVGTSDAICDFLFHTAGDRFLDVVHNPEFLRQGNAVHDFFHPDRIVIGCQSKKAADLMNELYQDFHAPLIFTDRRSAELIKYASNAFLAMKISYINMMAGLCEKTGANVDDIAVGMGSDRRIGSAFLKAGAGYGGSCFPKDIKALMAVGKRAGCEMTLLENTERINLEQPLALMQKLTSALGTLKGKKIALLGLSFKPMTDDIREAPSLNVSRICLDEGAIVNGYDPLVKNYPVSGVTLHQNLYRAMDSCDAVLILTEWEDFRQLDWDRMRRLLRNPLIVDGRNLFSSEEMQKISDAYGITYISVGRPTIYSQKLEEAKRVET